MAIKGSLKEASLADVCQLLAMGQKTGCLSVTDRSRFGQIFFDRGRITYARIVNRRDRLGDLLVREGILDQQQLLDVLEQQSREPDRRVGELLIERGFITSKDLERYIRVQIEEAIYHLFTWSRGSFYFEVDERPDANDMLVSINPESLLLEAARRVDEWSLVEKKIPSLDLLFEVERDRVKSAGVELTPEQEKIIPLLDGSRSVQDIVDDSGIGEFDVGKALFGLIQAGFAHRVGQRLEAEPSRVRESDVIERRNLGVAFYKTGMLEDAAREFYRVLEVNPKDQIARDHIAYVTLREGNYRQSVRQLKQLTEDFGARYGTFFNLGFALWQLGRREEALLVLDEAEGLRDDPRTALARAAIHVELGDPVQARIELDAHRARLAGETPSQLYYYYAALSAALVRDLDAAEAVLSEALGHYAGDAPLLMLRGSIAERRNDLDTAERFYRQAAEEAPTTAQVHKNLGDIAYRRGEHAEALEHYKHAIEMDPRIGDDVYSKLGNLHFKRMQRADAVEYWRRALELNPSNQVVRNNLEIVENAG